MIIGPFVNGGAVILGGVAGAALGGRVPERIRTTLPLIFGCASMGLGIALIVKVKNLPPEMLAIVVGTIIGELCLLERGIQLGAGRLRGLLVRFLPEPKGAVSHDEFLDKFVAVMVLFCASGTGIFGALNEGMTGDPTMLVTKAILDLFTGAIFAISLGVSVATLAVPQFAIQLALLCAATLILPLTTPAMIADFSACGGLIMLATGLRICGIKAFPIANMLPALFIVMPLSALWFAYVPHS
jgi:uncharacterized protein